MNIAVTDNKEQQRFETDLGGGQYAFVTYRHKNGNIELLHTEVPEELEGQGIAGNLVKGIFEQIKEQNFKAVAHCSYIKVYLKRHPEYNELLADTLQ
jgi:predicted GNAT family acetyltransferase